MQGSVIIDFHTGWACSNEASMLVQKELITGDDGKRMSKHTNTVRVMQPHTSIGQMTLGMDADVVFKLEDSPTFEGFKTKIIGLTEALVIFQVMGSIEDYKSVTRKIKGGYNYGK